jgi:hypothetical protein
MLRAIKLAPSVRAWWVHGHCDSCGHAISATVFLKLHESDEELLECPKCKTTVQIGDLLKSKPRSEP